MSKKIFEINKRDNKSITKCLNEAFNLEIPRVVISTRYKYANIRWDGLALEPTREQLLEERGALLHVRLIDIYKKYYTPGRTKCLCMGPTGQVEEMSIEPARQAGSEIYDVLDELSDPNIRIPESQLVLPDGFDDMDIPWCGNGAIAGVMMAVA